MATSIGIKKGGLNISTCNLIFWTVVIPTLCFGCEAWVLKQKDNEILMAFQRYAARRLQRFHPRSLNITSFVNLGWMSVTNIIKARKLIFLRTILVMKEFMPIRLILIERIRDFVDGDDNLYDSPVKQALQITNEFGLWDVIGDMVDGNLLSKSQWKKIVWERAWAKEKEVWNEEFLNNRHLDLVKLVMPHPGYSIWWSISDQNRGYMKRCELMVRILCHTTMLKGDDCRLRRATYAEKMCILCEIGGVEDAKHIIMQCPSQTVHRTEMSNEISRIHHDNANIDMFSVMLGNTIEGVHWESMCMIWKISCTYIAKMYWETLNARQALTGTK